MMLDMLFYELHRTDRIEEFLRTERKIFDTNNGMRLFGFGENNVHNKMIIILIFFVSID